MPAGSDNTVNDKNSFLGEMIIKNVNANGLPTGGGK
jgi:hypothetical protein